MTEDAEMVSPPQELRRSLGLVDAVVIGLGSMLGAGIFAALAPAAQAAGSAVELGAESLHAPRLWPEYHEGYFAAFVRDPDGNNVEAVCHG